MPPTTQGSPQPQDKEYVIRDKLREILDCEQTRGPSHSTVPGDPLGGENFFTRRSARGTSRMDKGTAPSLDLDICIHRKYCQNAPISTKVNIVGHRDDSRITQSRADYTTAIALKSFVDCHASTVTHMATNKQGSLPGILTLMPCSFGRIRQ